MWNRFVLKCWKKVKLNLDETYWSQRYQEGETGWDIGYASTPLQTYFDQLHDKNIRILIPGAGNAYEAEYLVQQDFTNVFVCDLSEKPLQNLKTRCPQLKEDQLILGNFFELNTPGHTQLAPFDLIVEQTFFCALDPSLRMAYFEKMLQLLKPGGRLVGVLFNTDLNTDKPPFGGNKEEYLRYIGKEFNIKTFDTCYNSIKPREGRELFMNLEKRS